MRVVLDTNILISALLSPSGAPAAIYSEWEDGRFTLLSCEEQFAELRATLEKPKLAALIKPHRAGRLVNQIRRLCLEIPPPLPQVKRSPDPNDDFLLALCEAGQANFLVTGDKSGLVTLGTHKSTRILTPSEFIKQW